MQYLISYYNRHHYGNNEKNRIARCYRDEDARGDRQPEFTQIDMEMSFVSRDDVLSMTEGMMAAVFKDTMGIELRTPFPRIAYDDAIEWYGSDKPELRFDMKMQDIAKACNYFFKKQFAAEYEKFYEEPAEHISKVLELKRIIDSIKEDDKNTIQFNYSLCRKRY